MRFYSSFIDIDIPPEFKNIGVDMSGGMVSTMLAFMLAKTIKVENRDVLLHPITARIGLMPDNISTVEKLVSVIKSKIGADVFGHHWTFTISPEFESRADLAFVSIYNMLIQGKKIDGLYSGTTVSSTCDALWYGPKYEFWASAPFVNKSKVDIMRMYRMLDEEHGLMSDLLPLTDDCILNRFERMDRLPEECNCPRCTNRKAYMQEIMA